jgi:mycothiol synthase
VTIELRAPRIADAAELAAAVDEFGRLMDGDRMTTQLAETWLGTPSLDLERDARVALADGHIAAFGDVFDSSHRGEVMWTFLAGDPAAPEIWSPLLDFVEARAAELAVPGGRLKVSVPEKAVELRELLESRGWAFDRFSFRMLASLDGDLPEPEWPEGISVRRFSEEDAGAVHDVQEETFAEHDDHMPISYEDWRHWWRSDHFEPGLWTLALGDGELQGIALCRGDWEDDPAYGWVSILGVRRRWRGRGLGLALLRHSFRQLQARGMERAGLGVDSQNSSGVRLYERAGMHVARRKLTYAKKMG